MADSRTRLEHQLISQHQQRNRLHEPYMGGMRTTSSSTTTTELNGLNNMYGSNIHNNNSHMGSAAGSYNTGMTGSVTRMTELRNRVQATHLSYLSMEDKPEKIHLKSKLEGLIFELVSIVPHSQKFVNVEVANCFNQTVVEKEKFSPSHVSDGFERLEKYATNLIRHSWRHEYRVVHSYSGFYRHLIQNCLIGVLPVMHAMGYRERDPDHPGQFILEQFLDPDRLTSIALDCLVAFVELQIMLQMREMLKSKDMTVSYDEIFTTRVRYICGMDQAVHMIADSLRSSRNSPPIASNPLIPVSSTPLIKAPASNLAAVSSSFDLLSTASSPNAKTYASVTHMDRQSPLTPPVIAPPAMFANESSVHPNGHQNLLLDHEPPVLRSNMDHQLLDQRRSSLTKSVGRESIARSDSESSRLQTAQSPNYAASYARKLVTGDDEANGAAAPYPSSVTSYTSQRHGGHHQQQQTRVDGSSLRSAGPKIIEHAISLVPDVVESGSSAQSRPLYKSLAPWSCLACTFVNRRTSEFCEMCSRSREQGEPSPLVSGGKECSVCTLVNSRDSSHCRACGTDLFDSPTYI